MAQVMGKVQPKQEKRNPDFTLRAKSVNQHNGKETWQNIGAMWLTSWTDKQTGEEVNGYSVKINTQPTGWTGDALAMPYKEFEN